MELVEMAKNKLVKLLEKTADSAENLQLELLQVKGELETLKAEHEGLLLESARLDEYIDELIEDHQEAIETADLFEHALVRDYRYHQLRADELRDLLYQNGVEVG